MEAIIEDLEGGTDRRKKMQETWSGIVETCNSAEYLSFTTSEFSDEFVFLGLSEFLPKLDETQTPGTIQSKEGADIALTYVRCRNDETKG